MAKGTGKPERRADKATEATGIHGAAKVEESILEEKAEKDRGLKAEEKDSKAEEKEEAVKVKDSERGAGGSSNNNNHNNRYISNNLNNNRVRCTNIPGGRDSSRWIMVFLDTAGIVGSGDTKGPSAQ